MRNHRGLGTGEGRGAGSFPRTQCKALLLVALVLASLAPGVALAFDPKDGLYYVGSASDIYSVQTLPSGLTLVIRTNFTVNTKPLTARVFFGLIASNLFHSTETYGYANPQPTLDLNFSSPNSKLTYPGTPPTVINETLSFMSGWGATSGPYDKPYWVNGNIPFVQTMSNGYTWISEVWGTTNALSARVYYRNGTGTPFTAQYFRGLATPYPSISINFATNFYTYTPSGGSPTTYPMWALF